MLNGKSSLMTLKSTLLITTTCWQTHFAIQIKLKIAAKGEENTKLLLMMLTEILHILFQHFPHIISHSLI